eukprot:Skav203067  [mRNA]  locus=scaffold4669:169860:170702:- [translate_table: standard]
MSFASLALPWERPLLGPLFAWSSAVRGTKGLLRLPWVVLLVLSWIRGKLERGLSMEEVRPPEEAHGTVQIWTDAKATEDAAWIGGWVRTSENTKQCEWFSEKVTEEMAPWMFSKGRNPKRVIAALEMLGTLVALKLWAKNRGGGLKIHTQAFTDNKGNEFILKKGMSTKFPITLLVIEASETLRRLDTSADLTWVRRDDNQEADDLTNEKFDRFSEDLRVRVTKENCKWIAMDDLLPKSEELYLEIQRFKKCRAEEKKMRRSAAGKKRSSGAKFFGRWHS